MPKKITSITIDNYRAWYGLYESIKLPNGENLLVYGENGSGKSSFFKGVQNFFRSATDGTPAFELNIFSVLAGNTNGSINIEFTDFPPSPAAVNQYQYSIGTPSTNNETFINDSRKLNSFLDYKHMLGVHFTNPDADTVPDLFPLLIENLLGGYNLPATAINIKDEIASIVAGLKRKSDSVFYDEARDKTPIVSGAINTLINDILVDANRLLTTYFDNDIEILLVDFTFRIKPAHHKELEKLLRIQTRYAGQVIPNYNYFLNEARLSSVAICFYLASVLSHPPAATGYKPLFLDDIFIGLDTSNRIPLLELINAEFADYQIVITTYDRFWYEVAKDWFDKNMSSLWVYREMYVHKGIHATGVPAFDKTIILEGENDFAKALYHLNNSIRPDYPAAANYLRKYAEGIFKEYIPEVEYKLKDENIGEFPNMILLNALIIGARNFLHKISQTDALLVQLKGQSKRLLNPLSHYNPSTPIFKRELDDIVSLLPQVEAYLKNLRENTFRLSLNEFSRIRIHFPIAADDDIFCNLILSDQLYKYRNGAINFSLCSVKWVTIQRVTLVGTTTTKYKNDFADFQTAYTHIHGVIAAMPGMPAMPVNANFIDQFQTETNPGTWNLLNTLLVW